MPRPSPHDVLLGAPALKDAQLRELQALRRRADVLAKGVLAVHGKAPLPDLAFSRQLLPAAVVVEGAGPADLADHAAQAIVALDEEGWLSGALIVEVSVVDAPRTGSRAHDAHPLDEGVAHVKDILEKKRAGRARKQGVLPSSPPVPLVVELLVIDAWRACLATEPVPRGDPLTSWPSPFPAGRAPVPVDKSAPSSAHRKLDEALLWLGAVPGKDDTVVDLGAAPGGWTHVALKTGARVIAVDRGDMDPRVMATGRVTHVRKDAFQHAPLDDADWLVCDIIVEPFRTLALLEDALTRPRLRAFVVTLKLKEPVDLDVVTRARALLAAHPRFETRVKNLFHNKIEVTVLGRG